ncbi:aminotransferase class I/II-fold pyridoxal phosphate-dependent enzyme, partial [Rhodopseudomonas palustris]
RRERLAALVAFADRELKQRCGITSSGSHILPIIVGANSTAVALAASLQRRGFDVRAIRPPTVPEGTARLRIALSANLSEDVIASLFAALAEDMRAAA